MKFVIIGGDAAGMSAASRAKRNNPDLEVIVFEQTQDVSYSACGMPYNIADPHREMDDLIVRKAEVFRDKNQIDLRTGYRVDAIDTQSQTVSGITMENEAFSSSYDKLLIATGARPILQNIPGITLPGVMALKSLEQGRAIKAFIDATPIKKAVIIGMGYIGLEMCEALNARGIDVTMVKPRPLLLPWMTRELADVVTQELEAHQVMLHFGEPVEKIEPGDHRALTVQCGNTALDAGLVIVASGVAPCSELASMAGLATGISNAIAVDQQLRTSNPDIYAAGDCADARHVVTEKPCWIPLALRANRAGWAVADNVCGIPTSLQGVAGTAVFKVFDLQVARTGLTLKEAMDAGFDAVETVVKTRSKAHGHPGAGTIYLSMVGDKTSGRLLGVQMVGKDGVAHRINAPAVALHAKMSVADFIQTDLAYAPPFGPVWDPVLTAANQLIKKM